MPKYTLEAGFSLEDLVPSQPLQSGAIAYNSSLFNPNANVGSRQGKVLVIAGSDSSGGA
jgi:hypothetical protein